MKVPSMSEGGQGRGGTTLGEAPSVCVTRGRCLKMRGGSTESAERSSLMFADPAEPDAVNLGAGGEACKAQGQ